MHSTQETYLCPAHTPPRSLFAKCTSSVPKSCRSFGFVTLYTQTCTDTIFVCPFCWLCCWHIFVTKLANFQNINNSKGWGQSSVSPTICDHEKTRTRFHTTLYVHTQVSNIVSTGSSRNKSKEFAVCLLI